MHAITTPDGESFTIQDIDQFESYLLNKCKKHHNEGRAFAFAFLVHDFYDVAIQKILDDADFWSSLNELSGRYLTVFYINLPKAQVPARQPKFVDEKNEQKSKTANTFYYMHSLGVSASSSEFVNEIEGGESSRDLTPPFVLFFQANEEKVTDSFAVKLDETKSEDSFFELRDHIANARSAIAEASSEDRENPDQIFDLIKGEVKFANNLRVVKVYAKPVSVGVATSVAVEMLKSLFTA